MLVYISYRRRDTAHIAGRLFDALSSRYGRDHVYLDMVNIDPGVSFRDHISDAIKSSDAIIVVIGRDWLMVGETGARGINDPGDFVRVEVATALKEGKVVVPVLVDGAKMPSVDQLPADLKVLAKMQAVKVGARSFHADIETLAAILERGIPGRKRHRWFWWRK